MSENLHWVVERHGMPYDGGNAPFRYLSWNPCAEECLIWDGHYERALKFFDRASAEMMCVEMPFEWDVRIVEHSAPEDDPRDVRITELEAQLKDAREALDALGEIDRYWDSFWAFIQGEYGVTLSAEDHDDHNVFQWFLSIDKVNRVVTAALSTSKVDAQGEGGI